MNRRALLTLLAFPLLSCSSRSRTSRPLRVVIVGDATAQTYSSGQPSRGWGQYIGERFSANVEVVNLR